MLGRCQQPNCLKDCKMFRRGTVSRDSCDFCGCLDYWHLVNKDERDARTPPECGPQGSDLKPIGPTRGAVVTPEGSQVEKKAKK